MRVRFDSAVLRSPTPQGAHVAVLRQDSTVCTNTPDGDVVTVSIRGGPLACSSAL